MRRTPLLAGAAALVVGAGVLSLHDPGYEVSVVMPAATNLVRGSAVQIAGEKAGKVSDLEARDGKAVVTVKLDPQYAPLHDGTTARISWKAVLGERILDLQPGPERAAALPDHAMIEGTVDRVELDQVLAALDEPTRASLSSLLSRLDSSLSGSETDLQSTLTSAGPAVEALGQVLQAVGQDGPAIRSLVQRLHQMTSVVAARHDALSGSIDKLSSAVDAVATQREALRQALAQLPSTLDAANQTLGDVPGTVHEATPLLEDLRPATARLPQVARQLSPVLTDLRPAVAQLRPTLTALDQLLGRSPQLLGNVSAVAPQLNSAGQSISPTLDALRPYAPELAGWLANWGSGAANYDANGHYLRAFVEQGPTSVNHNPGIMPPGVTKKIARLPGESEGQPWVDANGSELR